MIPEAGNRIAFGLDAHRPIERAVILGLILPLVPSGLTKHS